MIDFHHPWMLGLALAFVLVRVGLGRRAGIPVVSELHEGDGSRAGRRWIAEVIPNGSGLPPTSIPLPTK